MSALPLQVNELDAAVKIWFDNLQKIITHVDDINLQRQSVISRSFSKPIRNLKLIHTHVCGDDGKSLGVEGRQLAGSWGTLGIPAETFGATVTATQEGCQ